MTDSKCTLEDDELLIDTNSTYSASRFYSHGNDIRETHHDCYTDIYELVARLQTYCRDNSLPIFNRRDTLQIVMKSLS